MRLRNRKKERKKERKSERKGKKKIEIYSYRERKREVKENKVR